MRFKSLIAIALTVCFVCTLCACEYNPDTTKETSYTEEHFTANAVVTKYNKDHWYGGYQHHYRMTVSVYCEEYNLSKNFEETVSGMWINSALWDLKEGQTIKVVIYKRTYSDHVSTWIERISA